MLWVVDDQPTDDEWKEEKEMGTKNGYGLFLVSTSVLSVQLPRKENMAKKKGYVQLRNAEYKVCSENRCAFIRGVGSDVHERPYRSEPV
jgi:hypothetical protein